MNEPISKCLQLLACVILIPYERTCIEVLAGAWLLVLAALQVRALLVLACVILIPYERTRIEVLTGAWLRFFGFWVSILL